MANILLLAIVDYHNYYLEYRTFFLPFFSSSKQDLEEILIQSEKPAKIQQ